MESHNQDHLFRPSSAPPPIQLATRRSTLLRRRQSSILVEQEISTPVNEVASQVNSASQPGSDLVPKSSTNVNHQSNGDPLLPLEENIDYLIMQQHLSVIRHQLARSKNDLAVLIEQREQALSNPRAFIDNLQNLKVPERQPILPLPPLNLRKYDHLCSMYREQQSTNPSTTTRRSNQDLVLEGLVTRLKELITTPPSGQMPPNLHVPEPDIDDDEVAIMPEIVEMRKQFEQIVGTKALDSFLPKKLPRRRPTGIEVSGGGRGTRKSNLASNARDPIDSLKRFSQLNAKSLPWSVLPTPPSSSQPDAPSIVEFKKADSLPWSVTERRRLELLLVEHLEHFPPISIESITSIELQRIALELGTRTPVQVSSRLQQLINKYHKASQNKSSFYETEQAITCLPLKRARWIELIGEPVGVHWGHVCDRCGLDPIIGIRWQCSHCTTVSTSFCDRCVEGSSEVIVCFAEHHPLIRHEFPLEND